jgi:hypothetical protein
MQLEIERIQTEGMFEARACLLVFSSRFQRARPSDAGPGVAAGRRVSGLMTFAARLELTDGESGRDAACDSSIIAAVGVVFRASQRISEHQGRQSHPFERRLQQGA